MTPRNLLPHPARIVESVYESADTRTFTLALEPPDPAFDGARPGQFAMLSILGHGEAAFSFSSVPGAGAAPGTAGFTIRRVGCLTGALFDLGPGALVGVRGPFGRGFPAALAAQPTVYVAGGCGLAPLKPAIDLHVASRPPGMPLAIVYGARDPEARILRASLSTWERAPGVVVLEYVESGGTDWWGRIGLPTEGLAEAVGLTGARHAAVCGPSVMLRLVADGLRRTGLAAEDIHLALERHMKCGVGLCGHCYVNHRYVCTDGPVFPLAELLRLPDALPAVHLPGEPAVC